MEDTKNKSDEIVSLNQELMSFDFDDLSVEELERRLELAIGVLPMDFADCGVNNCNTFSGSCGNNTCDQNTCPSVLN
jgi:hypothetical protein